MKNWWLYPLTLVLVTGVSTWLVMKENSAQLAAQQEIVDCRGERESEFKCWQQRYDALVAQQSPKAALADAQQMFDTVAYVKGNCHQIAHLIGRASAKKFGDVIKAFNEGNEFCSSGYYHGTMEEIAQEIGSENIVGKINEICDATRKAHPYSLTHHNCTHGLGHGLMGVFDYELFEALDACEHLEDTWQQDSCYGGVFMENIMAAYNETVHTDYLKDDDPQYPCNAVADKYKSGCYIIQTSQMLRLTGTNYKKVFGLCSEVKAPFDAICFQSLGRDISGFAQAETGPILERCMLGDTSDAKTNCFIGAVKDVIWYRNKLEAGLDLCNAITDNTLKSTCTQTASTYFASF